MKNKVFNQLELEEAIKILEEQGWEPMLCDTPIPYYDNPVSCGSPTGVGDLVEGKKRYPHKLLSMMPEFVVKVKGDSMIDAGIEEGDTVRVESRAPARDGDIVLVSIDDDVTVKAYCEDDDGHPWLVPQNEKYAPFPLMERDNVWIIGVVVEVTKQAPRVAARTLMKAIKKASASEPPIPTRQQVVEMIVTVAPMVKNGRQWYGVFRALVDKKYFGKADFEAFCELVAETVPQHKHLPSADQIQRLAVQSFARSVALWNENDAPVKGKTYRDYKRIADSALNELSV